MSAPQKDRRLEIAMGNMLRIGVTLAALVVLAGGTIYLFQSRGPAPDYSRFVATSPLISLGSILAGAFRLQSRGLIELGILLLIVTPVFRVVFGLVGFALLRDRFYAIVSAAVLAVLLFSFFSKR